jgi:glycylpeptide N-tetradecanoyltransferase
MPHGKRDDHPEGPIEPDKAPHDIRQQPYAMPAGFEWSLVNVNDPMERSELYTLLAQNYVEDDDALFRFDYSPEFLLWALTPPGYDPNFIFGVRSKAPAASSSNKSADAASADSASQQPQPQQQTRKLVAFISGVPATLRINSNTLKVVEINFLCVHKKLRSKRLAPVLIKEMTRRVNLAGTFQAVYTAGTVLPVPVSTARYHHRSLNPKKLVQVGFSRLSGKMTLGRLLKLYKLPDETSIPGLRPMALEDVPGVHQLLDAYMTKFAMKIVFTQDDVAHWLLPRDRVVHSYVVDARLAAAAAATTKAAAGGSGSGKSKKPPSASSPATTTTTAEGDGAAAAATPASDPDATDDTATSPTTNPITDLISFYHLPSSILKHNDTLFSVYSYYNVATSVSLVDLMRDALVLAKRNRYDVFNALNLMDNDEFLEPLKFGLGDGHLQYYVYNWACPDLPPSQVGIVLL